MLGSAAPGAKLAELRRKPGGTCRRLYVPSGSFQGKPTPVFGLLNPLAPSTITPLLR